MENDAANPAVTAAVRHVQVQQSNPEPMCRALSEMLGAQTAALAEIRAVNIAFLDGVEVVVDHDTGTWTVGGQRLPQATAVQITAALVDNSAPGLHERADELDAVLVDDLAELERRRRRLKLRLLAALVVAVLGVLLIVLKLPWWEVSLLTAVGGSGAAWLLVIELASADHKVRSNSRWTSITDEPAEGLEPWPDACRRVIKELRERAAATEQRSHGTPTRSDEAPAP